MIIGGGFFVSCAKVYTATAFGLEALPVEIEADLSNGLPSFLIVGLPDKAVEESKERVRAAIKNSGLLFPQRRITVNLAPADIKKEGPLFDLPIAVSLMLVSEQVKFDPSDSFFMGELSLNGELRHTDGVLPVVHFAKKAGIKRVFIPKENIREASIITGIEIYPISSLLELYRFLKNEIILTPTVNTELELNSEDQETEFDIAYIKGQEHAKRALEIAAAGGHNLLFSGPPGSGKTMLARTLASILPPLDFDEVIELTKIYSVAGLLNENKPLIKSRPFRNPHHTSSDISLVGGGRWPKPGEISLAHRGVLFLDEVPEFSRSVLEVLRQPLEDGFVNVSRASGSLTFPAQFILVASQNPCPCGYLGDDRKKCLCSPLQVSRYQKKISGPLLDRIDLHLEVPRVEIEKLSTKKESENSAEVRKRVLLARENQIKRFKGTKIKTNAEMNQKAIEEKTLLTNSGKELLKNAAQNLALSARSYFRIIKVARTIADLESSELITEGHVAEALQYRLRR